jgi:aldose sugar dehydrogenase
LQEAFMRTPTIVTRLTLTATAVVLAALVALAQQPQPAPGGAAQMPGGGRQGGRGGPNPFPRPPATPFPETPQDVDTLLTKVRVVGLHKGLANPWSLTFLPNGDMLVTERPGRLRIVRNGTLDPQPIAGVPTVWAVGQGGLLEVLPHPRFAQNQYLYLTYSKPCEAEKSATTALARGKFDGKALTEVKDLFVADNCNTGNPHFGSKLAWGSDGFLYMTIGERGDRKRSQDPASHGGKLLRLTEDGAPAPGNPFAGKAGFKPEIYTWGHRNAQGLAFHPGTGALWLNEHGPQGGDELNLIEAGKNYGWPVVSHGREYAPDGSRVSEQTSKEGMEDPVLVWVPSIGISGMIFYTGDKFPQWKGNVIVGGLSGLGIHRVGFNDKGGLLGREAIDLGQRIRDVRQGPDGFIYLAVDSNPGGILRLEPAQAAPSTASGR